MRIFFISLTVLFLSGCQYLFPKEDGPLMKMSTKVFYDMPDVGKKVAAIDYDISIGVESFKVMLPLDMDKEETYGLVLFISPVDKGLPPTGWEKELHARKLLLISPINCGNDQPWDRRLGLALLGVKCMQKEYKIDPKRIYGTGMSGGARAVSNLAMLQPELFSGTVQSVGSVFVHEVPTVKTKPDMLYAGEGLYWKSVGAGEMDTKKIKENVRFVIITGNKDYRYGNLQDIYNGGFKKDGYQCLFIDVPNMGHRICDPEDFTKALDFIEGKEPAAAE